MCASCMYVCMCASCMMYVCIKVNILSLIPIEKREVKEGEGESGGGLSAKSIC